MLEVRALVDSGADRNVFGMDIAKRLEIDFEDARPVTVIGVGEQVSEGVLAWVEYRLGRRTWGAETIFSEHYGYSISFRRQELLVSKLH